MKKMQSESSKSIFRKKVLASLVAAASASLIATGVSHASDIEIYQEAKSGQITLMLLFDLSGSMSRYFSTAKGYGCDLPSGVQEKSYDSAIETPITGITPYRRQWCVGNDNKKYYDRVTRLKDAVIGLLYGDSNNKITRLTNDKVIGLATFQGANGYIRIPARPLGENITITKTQRDILIDEVLEMTADGSTPTFKAFTEVASYMMGTNTQERALRSNTVYYFQYNNSGTKYRTCTAWDTISGECTKFAAQDTTNPLPKDSNFQQVSCSYKFSSTEAQVPRTSSQSGTSYNGTCYRSNWYIKTATTGSGYPQSYDETKIAEELRYRIPASLTQTDEIKKCSGQGIYVLTDGEPTGNQSPLSLMKNALDNSNFTCSSSWNSGNDWNCAYTFNDNLLLMNRQTNPLGLKIKTAIVGFGSSFALSDGTTYDKGKTKEENIEALGSINSDQKRAAKWGILGEGGWYSGSSSRDVVDSVNNFINDLSTEIPSVTTGSPTIPKDALNPAVLQNDAYYQQFEPTPDKTYQLWMGNLKKYFVATGGVLKDKNGKKIVDDDGKILDNYDYWAYPVEEATKDADGDTPGSIKFALHGGVWSQLALRTNPINDPVNGTVQRKVLTNRVYINGSGTGATFGENSSNTLRRVLPTDLTDNNYKNDPNRGYLVRLLGYNIDAANPPANTDALKTAPEFRQMGAVMHSSPLLVTNKGKLNFNTSTKTMQSTNREDYVLFGSTQGILHVVKAGSSGVAGGGEEVFAFVPNEMVERQKQAFEKVEATNGGIDNLYYGIDGPWTAYTEYVIDSSGYLTVGNGKGNQKGVQDVYGGLRMGGKSYYALDLRDINNPKMKLHIDPSGTCSDTNPLGCMGESWSKPAIGFVNWGGKRTRVMFVGGGYDRVGGSDNKGYENPAYDQINKIGAGVYMFRAEDEKGVGTGKAGQLLWWSSANAKDKTTVPIAKNNEDMKYSVVSEIRTVDRDGDDLIDHIYFGDLGGQIFRADFDNKQSAIANFSKKPVRIFDGHKADGKSPRFYDMPAFSLYSSNGTIFAVISQGSGNRSKPLFADGTYDYDAIYNIYDQDVARKDLYSATSWSTQNIKPDDSTGLLLLTDNERKNDSTIKAPASSKGWYYEFTKCVTGKGACSSYTKQTEKVFGTPIVLNKKLFVSTFDASKDGLAGDCGAGVKGASLMTTFCMPFGQCKSTDATGTTHSIIGAGIHTITVGNDDPNGGGGSGDGSDGNGGGGGGNNPPPDVNGSTKNYCISTGGRMTITVAGGIGTGEQTKMCLIPQRWYEKFR